MQHVSRPVDTGDSQPVAGGCAERLQLAPHPGRQCLVQLPQRGGKAGEVGQVAARRPPAAPPDPSVNRGSESIGDSGASSEPPGVAEQLAARLGPDRTGDLHGCEHERPAAFGLVCTVLISWAARIRVRRPATARKANSVLFWACSER